MQQIHFLHYQENLHLHNPEMQTALDSQTPMIGTNVVLLVHHLSNPEMHLDVVD